MHSLWSSLLGFGTVPGDADEVRAFLHRRVRLFAAFLAAFHLFVYAVEIALRAWLGATTPDPAGMPPLAGGVTLTAGVCLTFLALLLVRRIPVRTLAALDAGLVVFLGAMNGWLLSLSDSRPRPEYGFVVGMVFVLVVRAALVPSPASRTALLALLGFVPLVAGTWITHARGIDPPFLPPPAGCAAVVVLWTVMATGVTTFVARTIHGLERRVREAARLGQYTLEERIGEGGMGIVYRARHALLRRPTAVKLLPVDRAGEEAVARFEREVQHTCALAHPNTIAVYDFGRTPEGVFYYAMEYVDGFDLDRVVAATGPLPPGRVVHLLRQVAGALAEAHAAGLVHRDVKPANLMVCRRPFAPDFVKVLDFGLSREVRASGSPAESGARGITGTPLFLAPESAAHGVADPRSDVYALGAVAWFLLVGRPVFEGASIVQVCAHHLHTAPQPPSAVAPHPVPAALERLVLDCLAKSPEARPQDARAVLDRLEALGEMPGWSEADALAWWEREAPRLRAATVRPASDAARSIAVDFAGRAA